MSEPYSHRADVLNQLFAVSSIASNFELIKITAADYNGKDFDGSPFAPALEGRGLLVPFINLMDQCIKQGSVKLSNVGCTDYATWDFIDKDGKVKNYGPGDFILYNKDLGLVPFDSQQIEAIISLFSSWT